MIQSFKNQGTRDVFDGVDSRIARRTCPIAIRDTARRKFDQLNQAVRLDDLRAPPNNRLEPLRGDRSGQHSIRVNRQYRICFHWTDSGPEEVEIVDYHD